jgi:hypothetical protein
MYIYSLCMQKGRKTMGNFLAIFKPKTPVADAMPVISVPDIKEYLVKEYERVNDLKLENERLREQLEQARELKLKYDAALVTLDEYSKRQEIAKLELQREKERTAKARQDADQCRDLANTYKIQFNNAAITKEQIKDEITSEIKAAIIERIRSHKGNLSKQTVCEIISA